MSRDRDRLVIVAVMAGLVFLLAGFSVFDIVEDAGTRNDPLWSTVLESAVPLLLNVAAMYAGYRLYSGDVPVEELRPVAKWFGGSVLAMGLVMAWVVGFETVQSRYDPIMIVTNTMSLGAVAGLGIGIYDVRRRRQSARAEFERNRARALFENSPDAVARIGLDGSRVVVEDANEEFEAVFGHGGDVARDGGLEDVVVPDDDPTSEAIRAAIESGERAEQEVTRLTTDGEREFILRTIPVSSTAAKRREAFAVYTDITERKHREQELQETKEDLETAVRRLERSNEELEQFAYIASHDLQEPLRMVSSYMDLLEKEYGDEFGEEGREYMDYAVDGATRMQNMIDDLLTFSRVGERNLDRERLDADEVLDEVLQDLRIHVEETDATVTREELPEVYADRSQLSRVFQNLVSNALDYAGESPPEVHVGVEERPREYVFSIEDEGIGIPENQQDRIFDIFTRGERNDEDGGTGIGLTLCRRIVQAHDGKIWIESEGSEGTTFYFTLPKSDS